MENQLGFFSRFIECDKSQGSTNNGKQGFSEKDCEMDKIISLGPWGSIETNISKKAFLTVRKAFDPFFFVLSSVTNHRGTKYKRPQPFLRITVEDLRSFL